MDLGVLRSCVVHGKLGLPPAMELLIKRKGGGDFILCIWLHLLARGPGVGCTLSLSMIYEISQILVQYLYIIQGLF